MPNPTQPSSSNVSRPLESTNSGGLWPQFTYSSVRRNAIEHRRKKRDVLLALGNLHHPVIQGVQRGRQGSVLRLNKARTWAWKLLISKAALMPFPLTSAMHTTTFPESVVNAS